MVRARHGPPDLLRMDASPHLNRPLRRYHIKGRATAANLGSPLLRKHKTSSNGRPRLGAKADKRNRWGESIVTSLQHHCEPHNRALLTRRDLLGVGVGGMIAGIPALAWAAAPNGQLTWAVHVTLAPTWLDPAETSGIITPYMVLYALHDAMAKPM